MASKDMSMRAGNKGLTVRINLFAMEKYLHKFDARKARLWMKGQLTNADTKEAKIFNGAGELITILGKWNAEKFKALKAEAKAKH